MTSPARGVQESENGIERRYERTRQFRIGRLAHDNEEPRLVGNNRGKFVRLVPDAAVMTERNPATSCGLSQPYVVRTVVREMVDMPLDGQLGAAKDLRELQAEVAVGEENNTQAARSYRTACSMSSRLSS